MDKSKGYGAYKLAAIYGSITGDYWGIVYNGCQAALDELKTAYGVDGYCMAPANSNDYTLQMDIVDGGFEDSRWHRAEREQRGLHRRLHHRLLTEDNMTPILLIDNPATPLPRRSSGRKCP
ncbi:MAG: hypothetical protein V8Q43_00280 [Christensenellaceae bacterium]